MAKFKAEIIGEDKLSPAARKARESTDNLSKATKGLTGSLGGVTSAFRSLAPYLAGTAILGAMTKMITMTAEAGDKFAKMSQKVGISVETLSTFDHVAKISGITLDTVAVGLRRFAQNALDMSRGIGEAKREFEDLGISVTDQSGKLRTMEDLVMEVAERFSKMEDGTTKTAMAMRLFGRSGTEMIPMLNKGKEGLRDMMDEAEKLGLVFSTETAQAMEQFNDNMTRLKAGLKGLTFFVGKEVIPVFTELLELFGFGAKMPLAENYKKAIASIKTELEGLESIILGESAWAKLNRAMMSAGAIEEAKGRIADLRAEFRLYTQALDDLTKKQKVTSESTVTLTAEGQKLKTELSSIIEKLKVQYGWTEKQTKVFMGLTGQINKAAEAYETFNAVQKDWGKIQEKIKDYLVEQLKIDEELRGEEEEAAGERMKRIDEEFEARRKLFEAQQGWTEEYLKGQLELDRLVEEQKDKFAEVTKAVNSLSDAFTDQLARGIADMVVEGKRFGDVMESVFRSLCAWAVQYAAKLLIIKAIEAATSVWGGGGTTAVVTHEGGVVKHTGGMIEKATVAHRGLLPDERLIIAQSGEGILSRRGVAAVGGSAGVEAINEGRGEARREEWTQNIYIVDERKGVPQLKPNDVLMIVASDIQGDGIVRKTIKRFA